MRKLGVILLSGGLDSTTVATMARRDGAELLAVTVHYGQTHSRELTAAAAVARALDLQHKVVDVTFFGELAWYSALTNPDRFTLPTGRDTAGMSYRVPITYVPLRNTFFITLAAAYLESAALDLIEVQACDPATLDASIFIAANAVDYSGYPDCRPEFYESMSQSLRLGSKLGAQYGVGLNIETPIIDKSKAGIVRIATELAAPIELTWSCYSGADHPCGSCDSCLLRAKGFAEAGLADPALTADIS